MQDVNLNEVCFFLDVLWVLDVDEGYACSTFAVAKETSGAPTLPVGGTTAPMQNSCTTFGITLMMSSLIRSIGSWSRCTRLLHLIVLVAHLVIY